MQIDEKFLSEQIKIAKADAAAALDKAAFMRGVEALAELLLKRLKSESEVLSDKEADGKG